MKDELAKRLVQGLKSAGVNFVTYLPETRLSQIVPLIRDDPEMELIAAASEQEAVTIAAGATLGGKCAAVYMENTGIYVSSYSLLTVGKQLGVPLLLVVGYLGGVADQRNSFLYATIGKHTVPVLEGLGIDYMILEDGDKLEDKIKDAATGPADDPHLVTQRTDAVEIPHGQQVLRVQAVRQLHAIVDLTVAVAIEVRGDHPRAILVRHVRRISRLGLEGVG